MDFYICLWIIACFLALTESQKAKPFNKGFTVFVFLIIALFVGFRFEVGADWASYKNFFYTGIAEDKQSGEAEPLFTLIRCVFYTLGLSHCLFFYALSLLTLLVLYKTTKLMGFQKFFFPFVVYVALFFCNYQFNLLRHSLMASFVWLAMAYVISGDRKRGLLCGMISAGFHMLGLISIPLIYVIDKKLDRKKVIFIISFSLICVLLGLSQRIMALFPFLAQMERVAGYIDRADYEDAYGLSIGTIFNLCLYCFLYFKYNHVYMINKRFRMVLNCLLVCVVLVCVLNAFAAIISRIGNLFMMSMMFALPYLYYLLIKRNKLNEVFIQDNASDGSIEKLKAKPRSPFMAFGLAMLIFAYLTMYYNKSYNTMDPVTFDNAFIPYKIVFFQSK